jgi:hypothetical protein
VPGCGTPRSFAGSNIGGLLLVDHGEIVWPEACVAPGQTVRIGLGTDCPCHSELEIDRAVWLPGEPLFKANVDCDRDVDAADALRDLLIAAGQAVTQVEDCPTGSAGHYYPDALGGVWGDINCDSQVTVLDVINILRTAEQLPSGIDANCRAQYGVYT